MSWYSTGGWSDGTPQSGTPVQAPQDVIYASHSKSMGKVAHKEAGLGNQMSPMHYHFAMMKAMKGNGKGKPGTQYSGSRNSAMLQLQRYRTPHRQLPSP